MRSVVGFVDLRDECVEGGNSLPLEVLVLVQVQPSLDCVTGLI